MPESADPSVDTTFLDPRSLDHLADSLTTVLARDGAGFLVHVIARADGPDVGILPLDGLPPADVLLGAVAPEDWSALGVATGAKAWSLDNPARSASKATADRVEIVVLVARDGRVVSRLRHGGQVSTDPPAYGLTLDCLQRAFGLPTAPPSVPPLHLLAVMWLERIVRERSADSAAELLAALEACNGPLSWERLRRLVAQGEWPELGLTREEAAWLDEGAFSRWVVGRCRPLRTLLREVRRVLPPADSRPLIRRLRRLGFDGAIS